MHHTLGWSKSTNLAVINRVYSEARLLDDLVAGAQDGSDSSSSTIFEVQGGHTPNTAAAHK